MKRSKEKMAQKIDTSLFIESWQNERSLWDVNAEIYKNRIEKAKSLKKLAEEFGVSVKNFYTFSVTL